MSEKGPHRRRSRFRCRIGPKSDRWRTCDDGFWWCCTVTAFRPRYRCRRRKTPSAATVTLLPDGYRNRLPLSRRLDCKCLASADRPSPRKIYPSYTIGIRYPVKFQKFIFNFITVSLIKHDKFFFTFYFISDFLDILVEFCKWPKWKTGCLTHNYTIIWYLYYNIVHSKP